MSIYSKTRRREKIQHERTETEDTCATKGTVEDIIKDNQDRCWLQAVRTKSSLELGSPSMWETLHVCPFSENLVPFSHPLERQQDRRWGGELP